MADASGTMESQPDDVPVVFDEQDLDLMSAALAVDPELKLAVHLVKGLRRTGAEYPITSVDVLNEALPDEGVNALGHRVSRADIERFFHESWFPVEDEFDALRKTKMALVRCQLETGSGRS